MDGITSTANHGFAALAGQVAEDAEQLISKVLRTIFQGEAFVPLINKRTTHQTHDQRLPFVEMLARHPDGQSAGHLFDEARKLNCVVEADVINLEQAVKAQLDLGIPVSVNLNAETFFSEKLTSQIHEIAFKYPTFKPEDFCLEITEQGGIPNNFDANALLALKKMGFALALDDFDPRQLVEQDRLLKFAPYVDIVKFPYQVLEMVRDGSLKEAETLGAAIKEIKHEYPHITFVMEGVRATDNDLLSTLKEMDIDLAQLTKYIAELRATRENPIAFPQSPFTLALQP